MSKSLELSDDGAELFARIIQANVNDLAHTNSIIQAGLEEDVLDVAKAFLALYDAVCASQVIDRQLLRAQDRAARMIWFAEQVVDKRVHPERYGFASVLSE